MGNTVNEVPFPLSRIKTRSCGQQTTLPGQGWSAFSDFIEFFSTSNVKMLKVFRCTQGKTEVSSGRGEKVNFFSLCSQKKNRNRG